MHRSTTMKVSALAMVPALGLTACGEDATDDPDATVLTLAHSYNPGQPQVDCGIDLIEEQVNEADAGIAIEAYGSSQLGGDADRIASVSSGDIDVDIQGASALGAVYEPVSVFDAAYAFDDEQHLADFMADEASDPAIEDFADETGIHTLGAWSAGARHFTADAPIQEPADLDGLSIRFPGSPQYLMNAQALGADATEVAYEEIYLSLQQGAVDGQENPINIVESENISEVQDYLSLSGHQLNTNLIIIGEVWDELESEQQEVLSTAVSDAVEEVTTCVAEEEQETLDRWETSGEIEVIDDVDVDTFRDQSHTYLEENLDGESLEVFEAIRGSAE